jgi:ATP-dependent RNA helicase DeaD
MGREGVAFTFVTPEQGPELTRIEIRIDSLLERAEITGFDTAKEEPPAAETAEPQDAGDAAETKPRAPALGRRGRPPRRYRRAL